MSRRIRPTGERKAETRRGRQRKGGRVCTVLGIFTVCMDLLVSVCMRLSC